MVEHTARAAATVAPTSEQASAREQKASRPGRSRRPAPPDGGGRSPSAVTRAVAALTAELVRKYPFLPTAHANRMAHAYGTRAARMLGGAKSIGDLGQSFGAT